MGKRIITQRRGKGSFTYRAHSHRYKGSIKNITTKEDIIGQILDIIKCPGHTAPLAKVVYENGKQALMPAPNGIRIKDQVLIGENVLIQTGNTLSLKNIPEGTTIYNIESRPGKPTFCRSAGSSAKVVSKSPKEGWLYYLFNDKFAAEYYDASFCGIILFCYTSSNNVPWSDKIYQTKSIIKWKSQEERR